MRYLPHGPFHNELHRRVDAYFASTDKVPNAARGMRLKTAVIGVWFAVSWALLTFWANSWWEAVALCVSLGLAMAGIGFNVQHDGGHGAYSPHGPANRLMAFGLDMLGASSYIWSWKHNVFHHSNTNVVGKDADIDIRPLCRLAPTQPRHAAHRFQHLYIWFLYSFLVVKWHFFDDFTNLATGKIGGQKFPRPRGWDLVAFFGGKLLFFGWALIIPSFFHPVWQVLLAYVFVSATVSMTLAIVFQLAHTVEDAHFEGKTAEADAPTEWSMHQIRTSVNFAPKNRLLSWYVGGLNYQIEHHLFPKICHLHLRDLSGIVQQTCVEFGVPYRIQPSARAAIASHARWIRSMGQAETSAA